tara:strand:+ start:52 stop:471 length:420 start_codon:yes stop_codon:yes gene_type:complete
MADKKKKILKTYKTAAGSQQYGSVDDFKKAGDKALEKFLIDPTGDKTHELLMRLDAGDAAARSKKFRELYGQDNDAAKMYDELEKRDLSRAGKKKAERLKRKDKTTKNIIKKAKGGAVRAYNNGGAVMAGRGPKYKGIR